MPTKAPPAPKRAPRRKAAPTETTAAPVEEPTKVARQRAPRARKVAAEPNGGGLAVGSEPENPVLADARRRLEGVDQRIKAARAHCKDAEPSKARDRARKELKRLAKQLRDLRGSLEAGITLFEHGQLVAALEPVEPLLDELVASTPVKRQMKQVRKAARGSRKTLERNGGR